MSTLNGSGKIACEKRRRDDPVGSGDCTAALVAVFRVLEVAYPLHASLHVMTPARVEGVREIVAQERHALVAMTRIVGVARN